MLQGYNGIDGRKGEGGAAGAKVMSNRHKPMFGTDHLTQ